MRVLSMGGRVFVNTTVHLDWGDRLRVLLGRPLHVDTATDIWLTHQGDDHGLLAETVKSQCWVEPFFSRRVEGAYHDAPRPETEAER